MTGRANSRHRKTKQSRHLLIVGCSGRKITAKGKVPALHLYDGVNFRVLKHYLLRAGWPPNLTVLILSAKYGLIDSTDLIETYDTRMSAKTAKEFEAKARVKLLSLEKQDSVFLNLGKDYLPALIDSVGEVARSRVVIARGGIGQKMKRMKEWLVRLPNKPLRMKGLRSGTKPYLYFFPDWDDFIHEPFSTGEDGQARGAKTYAHELCGKNAPFDGLLLSLSHLHEGKGILSRLPEMGAVNLRRRLRLPKSLLLFGDCGAFTYANHDVPPLTSVEAVRLYDRFGFDIGASVDHIPLPEIEIVGGDGRLRKKRLSKADRLERMILTRDNADIFLKECNRRRVTFAPLGVIQGLDPASYVDRLNEYLEMGYRYIALGGLVPRADGDIVSIVSAVRQALQKHHSTSRRGTWLHLFGILRPRIQRIFRELGVGSFDSASYFRKAWLRSDQNYLSPDGTKWYGSMRIPFSDSGRMIQGASAHGLSEDVLRNRERRCLNSVASFDGTTMTTASLMRALREYGPLLERKAENNHFSRKHSLLLRDQPWDECGCPFCKGAGIDVAVFRGAARNKRRGFHNTWVFYHKVLHGTAIPTSSQEGRV